MENSAQFFLTLGSLLFLGLFTSAIASRTFLPRVTLLLVFGALIGPSVFDLIPPWFVLHFDLVAEMTLLMVGFLLGGKLTREMFQQFGNTVCWIAITAAIVTAINVSLLLVLVGVSVEVAIILGCIASATAPAAILDVTAEFNRETRFSQLLLAIVALDDVVALVLFAVGIAAVQAISGEGQASSMLLHAARDLGGAVVLGAIIGIPAAQLTGRIRDGKPMLTEALALVFICGGLANTLEVSYLVASMVMGAVIANRASHHDYPFHAIEGIESLFMVVFFILAGASLEFAALRDLGLIGLAFILGRGSGKYLGAWLGGKAAGSSRHLNQWMGLAMMPQAGVPIGMALVAATQLPEHRQLLLSVVISATVIFEILGPILTRVALLKTAGDDQSLSL